MRRVRGVTSSTIQGVLLVMIALANPIQCPTPNPTRPVQLAERLIAVLRREAHLLEAHLLVAHLLVAQHPPATAAAHGSAAAGEPDLNYKCVGPSSCAKDIKDTPDQRSRLQQGLWQASAIVWQSSATEWQASATLWQDLAISFPGGDAVKFCPAPRTLQKRTTPFRIL